MKKSLVITLSLAFMSITFSSCDILLEVLSATLNTNSSSVYDSNHSKVGEISDDDIYNDYYSKVGYIDDDDIYNNIHQKVGCISGSKIYNTSYQIVGYIEDEMIYSADHQVVGYANGCGTRGAASLLLLLDGD